MNNELTKRQESNWQDNMKQKHVSRTFEQGSNLFHFSFSQELTIASASAGARPPRKQLSMMGGRGVF